jgi:hypothetical protein
MKTSRTLFIAACAALAAALGAAAQAKPATNPIAKAPCERTDTQSVTAWRSIAPLASVDAFADPFWTGRLTVQDIDRISADMERRMAELLQRIDELERAAVDPAAGLTTVGGGAGFCAQSVTITRTGDSPPRVERRTWGDCAGAAPERAGSTATEEAGAPAPDSAHLIHI